MGSIDTALLEHDFERLFVECLGWELPRRDDAASGVVNSRPRLLPVARRHGILVLTHITRPEVIADRRALAAVQRSVSWSCDEHIIVHHSRRARQQAWQWAVRLPGDRRIVHRQRAFASGDPPAALLKRLRLLANHSHENGDSCVGSSFSSVREALLPRREQRLFAKDSFRARKSSALALAVRRGEAGALAEFVEFHQSMVDAIASKLVRWFGMSHEDAEQTAVIAMLEAARRYDPRRARQFSIYASYWTQLFCQRYGVGLSCPLRMRPDTYWACYRMQFVEAELIATWGQPEAQERLAAELKSAGLTMEEWERFCRARELVCFSDLDVDAIRHVEQLHGDASPDMMDEEETLHLDLENALEHLSPRQAWVLSQRYGLSDREHTLQEIATELGVTRERVRQIQAKAEDRLQFALRHGGYTVG